MMTMTRGKPAKNIPRMNLVLTESLLKSYASGIMVGVQFDEGVVLAINMISNLIYYLDDHIL